MEYLPYKFTAKELDEETGLYYYGARYLDPKYSRWISTDPALGEYIPQAPVSDEARKHNQNLPGMGGVFNHINGNLYHYAGNNPVRYVDPDGREDSWAPLTYNALWHNAFISGLANRKNPVPVNNNKVGLNFENAVGQIFNASSNHIDFPNSIRPQGVRPDFVQPSKSIIYDIFTGSVETLFFPQGTFIEAKTSNMVTADGSGNLQMLAMIDAVANQRDITSSKTASKTRGAYLFIATPYDTVIDRTILDYATKKKVGVYQFKAMYNTEKPSEITLSSGVLLNNINMAKEVKFLGTPTGELE